MIRVRQCGGIIFDLGSSHSTQNRINTKCNIFWHPKPWYNQATNSRSRRRLENVNFFASIYIYMWQTHGCQMPCITKRYTCEVCNNDEVYIRCNVAWQWWIDKSKCSHRQRPMPNNLHSAAADTIMYIFFCIFIFDRMATFYSEHLNYEERNDSVVAQQRHSSVLQHSPATIIQNHTLRQKTRFTSFQKPPVTSTLHHHHHHDDVRDKMQKLKENESLCALRTERIYGENNETYGIQTWTRFILNSKRRNENDSMRLFVKTLNR